MPRMNKTLYKLVVASVIAAIYAVLTMTLPMISYGPIQCRISELLCILPFFFPQSAFGLYVGCVIANLMSTAGLPDIVFGSLATLFAGFCTASLGGSYRKLSETPGIVRSLAACAMPVLFNAPIVGAILSYTVAEHEFWTGFVVYGAQVGVGEAIVMFVLGFPIMRYVLKNERISGFFEGLR